MTRLILDDSKLRIRVCCGIHCSSDGGGHPLKNAFLHELDKWGVTDKVELFTAHCLGECEDGPCVRIGPDRFYRITPDDVPRLVRDEVLLRL